MVSDMVRDMASDMALPAGPDAETRPFWDAAARGVLLLKRCVDTGRPFYYPRAFSPFTGGATEWFEASGLGEVYSCSVAYRARPPYCIAYIRLDEGPIILSNIILSNGESDDSAAVANLAAVAIGQRVRAVFRNAGEGRIVPFFVPEG